MVKKSSQQFVNGRGQCLHTVSYVPEDSPRAVLIFHHGYGEHTGRYTYGAHTPAELDHHTVDPRVHVQCEQAHKADPCVTAVVLQSLAWQLRRALPCMRWTATAMGAASPQRSVTARSSGTSSTSCAHALHRIQRHVIQANEACMREYACSLCRL